MFNNKVKLWAIRGLGAVALISIFISFLSPVKVESSSPGSSMSVFELFVKMIANALKTGYRYSYSSYNIFLNAFTGYAKILFVVILLTLVAVIVMFLPKISKNIKVIIMTAISGLSSLYYIYYLMNFFYINGLMQKEYSRKNLLDPSVIIYTFSIPPGAIVALVVSLLTLVISILYLLKVKRIIKSHERQYAAIKLLGLLSVLLVFISSCNPFKVEAGKSVSLFDTFVSLIQNGNINKVKAVFSIDKNIFSIFTGKSTILDQYFNNGYAGAIEIILKLSLIVICFLAIGLVFSFLKGTYKKVGLVFITVSSALGAFYYGLVVCGIYQSNSQAREILNYGLPSSRKLSFVETFDKQIRKTGHLLQTLLGNMELKIPIGIWVGLVIFIAILIFSILYLREVKVFKITMYRRGVINGYLFILPWLIGFLYFFMGNIYTALIYSFNGIEITESGYVYHFIGWSNYKEAFTVDVEFTKMFITSIQNVLIQTPMIVAFSLMMAILVNREFRGRAIVRAIFFLPIIMTTSLIMTTLDQAAAAMRGGMTQADINAAASAAGGSGNAGTRNLMFLVNYLVEFGFPRNLVNYVINGVSGVYSIIRLSGVQILIFLAALQSIPTSLYEVAHIEGATAYETFWKVTFPLVTPLILTNVVYTIVDLYSRSTVVEKASKTAFTQFNMGLSSAFSVITSAAICLILFVVSYILTKITFYQV